MLSSPFFRLILRPCSWRTDASSGGLCVHAEVEIQGVPANVWNLATAEAVLAPSAWVERLQPLTRSHADMGVFRLSSWCLDPAREVDLHVVEPDDPPSAVDMAAALQEVVHPHVNTLAYTPAGLHVVSSYLGLQMSYASGGRWRRERRSWQWWRGGLADATPLPLHSWDTGPTPWLRWRRVRREYGSNMRHGWEDACVWGGHCCAAPTMVGVGP